MDELQQLLDRIDPSRHEPTQSSIGLNAFSELSAAEQDEEEFGRWGFAGLYEAQHPLLDLCGEAHNDFCVIRDLDGSLVSLFETRPGSGVWEAGPFFRQHVSELDSTVIPSTRAPPPTTASL